MSPRLRISVSGVRGKVPQALNVEVASRFASAFATYLDKGKIGFCRDSRPSSDMLGMAISSSLLAAGLDCVDYGLLPVPFLQFIMGRKNFKGGMAVSGGHNPEDWNAVVLLGEKGNYLESSEGSEVFNIYEAANFKRVSWKALGKRRENTFRMEPYLEKMSTIIDIERIRKANFKLVSDPCNGVVSNFLQPFADYFNLKLISLNNQPGKPFPHPPEPSQEHASQTEAVVKATSADFGFLLNSDGSRLSFVDEKGESLSEECTLPLCLLSLENRIRKAITTLSTSSLTDWAAEEAGVNLLKTKVGQSAVVNLMVAEKAGAGGEGSGSFALSSFSLAYDALLSLALVMDLVNREEKSLSQLVSSFPVFFMKKLRIEVPPERIYKIMDSLEEAYSGENPDLTDGIRIIRRGLWFQIRPSTTEFILRIIIEGKKEKDVDLAEEEIRERMAK
ncbi:MAG: hypothetical protein ACE5LC_09210 [Candidatus Aminicenantales bacterium]